MTFTYDDKTKEVYIAGRATKEEINDLLVQFEDDYQFVFVIDHPQQAHVFDQDYLNGFTYPDLA